MAGYRPQARDASEAIDRLVFAGLRAMTPAQRLGVAAAASRALHELAVAGLRLQYPAASAGELDRRAGARRLGHDLTLRFFGTEAEAWLDRDPQIR